MSFRFGTLPGLPAGISAEDIARLLGQAPAAPGPAAAPEVPSADWLHPLATPGQPAQAVPFGFGPITGGQQQAPESQPAPLALRVASRGTAVPPVASAEPTNGGGPVLPDDAPMPSVRVPMPPPRPLSFGALPTPEADMPAAGAVPTAGTMPAPTAAKPAGGPGFMDKWKALADTGLGDQLLALSSGLLSKRGSAGWAQGFQNMQKAGSTTAATSLAQTELALKQQKLARETQGQNATAQTIASKLGIPLDQAQGLAGNSSFVADFLKGQYGAPEGYQRTAAGTLQAIVGGPQSLETLRDRHLATEKTPDQIRQAAQAQAEGSNAGKPEDTTSDQKNYEQAKKQGYEGTLLDYQILRANASKAQTTINNAVNPVLKGLGEQFVENAAGARAAAETARAVGNARSQLDAPGGIFAGQWAENKLALQKMGAAFGITDPQSIANTETFRTQIKPIVLETVKGLGAGSGVSNADRDFALQAVGGDIKLDEATIRRVLDITDRSARAKVERHNSMASQMLETQPELKQVAPMLQVQLPEPYRAAAPNAPVAPGATTRTIGNKTYVKAPDGQWYEN